MITTPSSPGPSSQAARILEEGRLPQPPVNSLANPPAGGVVLGLVGGLGLAAGVFYYKAIVEACLEDGRQPRLVLVHADSQKVMGLASRDARLELATYLVDLLHQLRAAGAQIAAIPAFAPQVCAEDIARMTPLPLIDLIEVIRSEAKRRDLKRVAILGAGVTMRTALFSQLPDVDVVPLPGDEEALVADVYARLVARGAQDPAEIDLMVDIARRAVERDSLDAVIVAGTDFVHALTEDRLGVPTLDGARLHVSRIVAQMAGGVRKMSADAFSDRRGGPG